MDARQELRVSNPNNPTLDKSMIHSYFVHGRQQERESDKVDNLQPVRIQDATQPPEVSVVNEDSKLEN